MKENELTLLYENLPGIKVIKELVPPNLAGNIATRVASALPATKRKSEILSKINFYRQKGLAPDHPIMSDLRNKYKAILAQGG